MSGHTLPLETDSQFGRSDMSSPLMIFAALLIAVIAICGTLDSRQAAAQIDGVQVLNQENVAGPIDTELIAMCQRSKAKEASAAVFRRCRENKSQL